MKDQQNPIPKLLDIIKGRNEDIGGGSGDIYVSYTNLDEVFYLVSRLGWKQVSVSREIMKKIVGFFLANMERKLDAGKETLKILREGKVDKFLGVKLHLED